MKVSSYVQKRWERLAHVVRMSCGIEVEFEVLPMCDKTSSHMNRERERTGHRGTRTYCEGERETEREGEREEKHRERQRAHTLLSLSLPLACAHTHTHTHIHTHTHTHTYTHMHTRIHDLFCLSLSHTPEVPHYIYSPTP